MIKSQTNLHSCVKTTTSKIEFKKTRTKFQTWIVICHP
uniref:Uncharacterized protein n=1 Tax=Rhizophora mucronata TaxID=61149 RepID=A0A2P2NBW9_RHIMU